MGGGNN